MVAAEAALFLVEIVNDMRIISHFLLGVTDAATADRVRGPLKLHRLQVVSQELRRPPGMRTVVAGGAVNPTVTLGAAVELPAGGIIASVALFAAWLCDPGIPCRISHS